MVSLDQLSDPCPVCRFDGDHYTDEDVDGTLRSFDLRRSWLTEGVDGADRRSKPPGGGAAVDDVLAAAADAVAGLDGAGRAERLTAAHAVGHAMHVAGRTLRALGLAPGRQTGEVVGVFASDGGVPKRAIGTAEVGYRGVSVDRQAARRHHGRVWQALCLWSSDVVDALADEGHPIEPGFAGENISVRGLDWSTIRPGVQLRIGSVLAEVSSYATPCSKNAAWFADRDFNRMSHDEHPGRSRVYASVLEDGVVRPGDQVVVEP
jgi:MOSC domain-containing protein YiiM